MNALLDMRIGDAIHFAVERGASDIHVVAGRSLAMRVNGQLHFLSGDPLSADDTKIIARDVLSEGALAKIEAGGDFSETLARDPRVVLRVHGFRASGGTALAMRLLPREIPSLESLHLPKVVTSLMDKSRGLIIFAGPTGSGKSTSLAALLSSINQRSARRIVTIEDPIEYLHGPGMAMISQREVGRDTRSFSEAVVGALRADPDVIMIGEMRERSTMRAAITAAETGHLVLTTLHTGDTVQTVDRILDAFAGSEHGQIRAQLAASLLAVVCQRLVPRANGTGRLVATEVLIATDAVRNTIREARTHQLRNLLLTGKEFGMQTLENHLSDLINERLIEREAALSVSLRHDELRAVTPGHT